MSCRLTANPFALFALFVQAALLLLTPAPGRGAAPGDEPTKAQVAVGEPRPARTLAPASLGEGLPQDEAGMTDEDAASPEDDEDAKSAEEDSLKWFKARRAELEQKQMLRRSSREEIVPRADSTYLSFTREPAGISGEAVRTLYRAHRSQLQYCYAREVSRRPDLKGKVTFSCTVEADGRVGRLLVVEDTTESAALRQCLESRIRTWVFPRPSTGSSAEVELPTLFW